MATHGTMTTLADLQEIVGRDFACDAVEGDAIEGVRPRFVATPGAVAEVSALMRLAHGAGMTVAPRGNGTKTGWGNRPRTVDLVLRMERLNHVREHAAGDLVARAEAGVTLEALQATVRGAGQRLALNPPGPQATLGGIVAADPSGFLRLRYGTVRDLLIGVTVVLADGTVAKAGGKVVKNVAGYDLCKLFTGSLGTLGLIVETIWRLHPLPAARRTVAVVLDTPDAIGAAVGDLLHAPLTPLALDALELRWSSSGGSFTLAALCEGIAPGVVAQAATVERLLAAYGTARTLDPDAQDLWWREAGAYPWHEGDTGLKVTHLPAALPAVLNAIAELARAGAMAARVAGPAGTGVTYVGLSGGEAESVPALIAAVRARVARAEGSVVVPQAPATIKEKVDVWGTVGDALPLMRRVKERFDPEGILNPGRFVGGI